MSGAAVPMNFGATLRPIGVRSVRTWCPMKRITRNTVRAIIGPCLNGICALGFPDMYV
jgi:hypothetical protein